MRPVDPPTRPRACGRPAADGASQQLHEVAQVQARRRRVEAAVVRDRVAGQQIAQSGLVGGHVHEAAPDDLVPDVLERRVVGGLQRSHGGGFRHALQAISGLGAAGSTPPATAVSPAVTDSAHGCRSRRPQSDDASAIFTPPPSAPHCGRSVLVAVSSRRPRGAARDRGRLVVVSHSSPLRPARADPGLLAAVLAILGTALAIVGGNPFTRWVLRAPTGAGRRRARAAASSSNDGRAARPPTAARGGDPARRHDDRLPRAGVAAARHPRRRLSRSGRHRRGAQGRRTIHGAGHTGRTRRFIVGTMASLLWACAVAAIVWLAVW
jgi:hypothetical protein